MGSRLNPYINFDGNARDAMEFYKGVFGGELVLNTYGQFDPSPAVAEKIMHGQLEAPNGFVLMGADNPPGKPHEPGNNMAISLSGEGGDELRGYWAKLSDGGSVTVPLEKQMWGDEFGMLTDRFGVEWMVNITVSA